MNDFEQIGLEDLEAALDDELLLSRIKTLWMGDTRPDLEAETGEELSNLVLKTIARQLQSGQLSTEAKGFLSHCLDRKFNQNIDSLDEAFYLRDKKKRGGQSIKAVVRRATVHAFMGVIRRDTRTYDSSINDYLYSIPSKATLKEAYQAAFLAYRAAVGKDDDRYNDPEKKINQTIKRILKNAGVFR